MYRWLPLILIVFLINTPSAAATSKSITCYFIKVADRCAYWDHKIITYSITDTQKHHYKNIVVNSTAIWNQYLAENNIPLRLVLSNTSQRADISVNIVKDAIAICENKKALGCVEFNTQRGKFIDAIMVLGVSYSDKVLVGDLDGKKHEFALIFRIPDYMFQLEAMHEFGHLLGLSHTKGENYKMPTDVMAPSINPNMWISNLDTRLLVKIYSGEYYNNNTIQTFTSEIKYKPPKLQDGVPNTGFNCITFNVTFGSLPAGNIYISVLLVDKAYMLKTLKNAESHEFWAKLKIPIAQDNEFVLNDEYTVCNYNKKWFGYSIMANHIPGDEY